MLSLEFFYRFLISKRAGSLVKTISRISIVGIWLGVAALILVISVMNGFNRSIRSRLLEVEPHLVVQFDESVDYTQIKQHPVYEKLQQYDIELLGPMSHQDVILRTPEAKVEGAIASGVTRERLFQLLDYANRRNQLQDEDLREKVMDLAAGEVVFGVGLADKIGLFRDDTVVVIPPETLLMPAGEVPTFSQATVKGFLVTDAQRIDDHSFYYILGESFPRLQNSLGYKMALEVWLKDPNQVDSIKAAIAGKGYEVETWKERNASLFFALKIEKVVVSFLVGLSTLIAGLSIISVMVLLLTQKKKDIGNLLAMGMTKEVTRKTFVQIGMFLTITGILGGVITGLGLAWAVDTFSKDVLPAFYEETNIPAEVQITQVVSIVVFGFLFSFLALSLTIRKIATFRPSEILRG